MALSEPKLNLKAITCVTGTSQLQNCLQNVLKLLKVTNSLHKIDVYGGSPHALVRRVTNSTYFGGDGFLDINFPNPPGLAYVKPLHASVFLANFVKANPGTVTVISIGPLTNIALALHLNANFLSELKDLIVLGGSYEGDGNIIPGAEFNFYTDPEAASFVFNRSSVLGVLITVMPLETIAEFPINMYWRWTLLDRKGPRISFANQLELEAAKIWPPYEGWDTYAACYLIDRHFATATKVTTIIVEYSARSARGVVLIDKYNIVYAKKNAYIITQVDMKLYQTVFERVLT